MKKTNKILISISLFTIFVFGCFADLQAQSEPGVSSFFPIRIEKDFTISAKLENPAWQQVAPVLIEYQMLPDPEAKAPVLTTVKVLYSTHNLYVAFIANDPDPKKIRAQLADRDEVFADDYVGLFLDTYGGNQEAFEFFANPLGVQMDAFKSSNGGNNNGENFSFDVVWYSEGVITDSGYTVVMKIPFKGLNFPQDKIQNWRVQFFRNYPRNARYQLSWTKVSIGNSCLLCQSGTLKNISNIKGGGTVELLPYALASQASKLREPGNLSSGLDPDPIQFRTGGGISYNITSNTSLDAVINPDFSQIESDAAQISVNESFALFYPEKRPFFIRDADVFETRENLYYSRTINNPLVAAKFTHQKQNFNLGWLTAYDKNTPFIIPGQYESDFVSSSINSYTNILRGKYNFGAETFIGGLITTRNYKKGANYVGSLDWQVKLVNHYYLKGQLGLSGTDEINDTALFNDQRKLGETQYDAALNDEKFDGGVFLAELEREAKHYEFEIGYESQSPTFQSQPGFINKTNTRELRMEQAYSYYPAKKWLSRGRISAFSEWTHDFAGQLMERFIVVGLNNDLAGQTRLEIHYMLMNDERFRGHFFTGLHRLSIELESNPFEELDFGMDMETGKSIYRANEPKVGKGLDIEAYVTFKPTTHIQLNFRYNYSKLSSLDHTNNFFSGNILRLTGNYHFSRKLSFRLISQYNSFDEQLQIYPLFYYKFNPFTKFYLGMTDYLDQLSDGNGLKDFRESTRQFFVKAQYLIQW